MKTPPALAFAMLLGLPLATLAQPPSHRGMESAHSPERMTERMSRGLGLDASQTEKLRVVNERHRADMQQLREAHEKALREILTPEQWSRLEAERKQRREQVRQYRPEKPEPQT